MHDSGYGHLAYLTYPATQRPAADRVHLDLALAGVIVLEPEQVPLDDVGRAKLQALELAKLRCVDMVAVIHEPDGSLSSRLVDVVDYATTLGKRVAHYIGSCRYEESDRRLADIRWGGGLDV